MVWGAYDASALPFREAGRERDATNADHSSIVRFAIAPFCALALLLTGGCQLFQGQIAPERRPTVVGVIAEREVTQTNDLVVTLVDGTRVTLPEDSETLTVSSSAGPDSLLLADPTAAQPWFVSIPRQTAECFALTAPYAVIRQNALVLANGLVLPQAPDFVAGPAGADGRFDAQAEVCLSERGEALRTN